MIAKYLDKVGVNKTKSKEAVIPEAATDERKKMLRASRKLKQEPQIFRSNFQRCEDPI